MTIGSWFAGTSPQGDATTPFYAKKYWDGDDGKVITTRYTRTPKWNRYALGHFKYRMTNVKTGLKRKDNGAYSVVTQVAPGIANLVTSSVFPESSFDLLFTVKDEYKLLAKLLQKVKGHSYNLGVSLAEVDKLAGTIVTTITNLSLGIRDLKRLQFAQFARRFGAGPPSSKKVKRMQLLDISGRYLEMRYAWEPAIDDAYSACQAFEALSSGPRKQLFRAGRAVESVKNVDGNYHVGSRKAIARRSYTYEMYEELSAARQMGLANPASIIWERIPFSFVFDWFIPVGSYLELIGQVPFMKGRWMRSDSLRGIQAGWLPELVASISATYEPAPPYPMMELQTFQMRRVVSFSPPRVPTPRLQVHGAVQGKRILNAIALAHQLLFNDGTFVNEHYKGS